MPDVAKFARVCSYDRAGYGWSSAGPMPRTSGEIARELHALLMASGEKGPYVLVGHSFGGYNVRVYTGKYPAEVAGLVLVDASHEDQNRWMPPSMKKLNDDLTAQTSQYERNIADDQRSVPHRERRQADGVQRVDDVRQPDQRVAGPERRVHADCPRARRNARSKPGSARTTVSRSTVSEMRM